MPMQFADGSRTTKFDHTVPSDVTENLTTMNDIVATLQLVIDQNINPKIEYLSQKLDTEHASASDKYSQYDTFIIKHQKSLESYEHQIAPILQSIITSRFVRFLNYFGHWFYYFVSVNTYNKDTYYLTIVPTLGDRRFRYELYRKQMGVYRTNYKNIRASHKGFKFTDFSIRF